MQDLRLIYMKPLRIKADAPDHGRIKRKIENFI